MLLHVPALSLLALSLFAPVQATSSSLEQAHGLAVNQSLLWGTYRPNLYFGLRPRGPRFLTGLMWFGVNDYTSFSSMRHACDQGDKLESYTFTEHDGRGAAVQVIKDSEHNVELRTEFLKVPGGDAGGSWGVRISGRPLRDGEGSRISLVNYFGNDGGLGLLAMENDEDEEGIEGTVTLTGNVLGLGKFDIRIENDPTNSELTKGPFADDFGDQLYRTQYFGAPVPEGNIWNAKEIFMNAMSSNTQPLLKKYGQESPPDPALLFAFPNEIRSGANLYGFQKTYEGTWSVDIFYDSASLPQKLDGPNLAAGIAASSASYRERFARTFPLVSAYSASHVSFAQDMMANLIGGVGYFHGSSMVDATATEEEDEDGIDLSVRRDMPSYMTEPRELLTATPSRSFFPRGFYWDEGFHLLAIGAWDNDLSLEILKDWLNLIDSDGWLAREQILGEEARSKVPREFQTQFPTHANPPTLAMAVTAYISRLRAAGISLASIDPSASSSLEFSNTSSAETIASLNINDPHLAHAYLTQIYKNLKRNYDWFRATQRGQIKTWGRLARSSTEGYRWRGRTRDHVLTSGLDDYPRAVVPHVGELHLDLISWMGFFARTMGEIAEFLGEEDDVDDFAEHYEAIVKNIDDLHWSEEQQMYCDVSVDENDESFHVCHTGYISLFPLLLGLIEPDSPHLGPVLDLLRDPEQLWSPFGIRSLSLKEPLFGQGENYWRGPIWIPINYMVLSSLYKVYAKEPGPNQIRAGEIYAELRSNVVENVHSEYVRTGFTWEQYHPHTGQGQRSYPFTGWTSLVTLIMAEQY